LQQGKKYYILSEGIRYISVKHVYLLLEAVVINREVLKVLQLIPTQKIKISVKFLSVFLVGIQLLPFFIRCLKFITVQKIISWNGSENETFVCVHACVKEVGKGLLLHTEG
jgi:hypothetical protein